MREKAFFFVGLLCELHKQVLTDAHTLALLTHNMPHTHSSRSLGGIEEYSADSAVLCASV